MSLCSVPSPPALHHQLYCVIIQPNSWGSCSVLHVFMSCQKTELAKNCILKNQFPLFTLKRQADIFRFIHFGELFFSSNIFFFVLHFANCACTFCLQLIVCLMFRVRGLIWLKNVKPCSKYFKDIMCSDFPTSKSRSPKRTYVHCWPTEKALWCGL